MADYFICPDVVQGRKGMAPPLPTTSLFICLIMLFMLLTHVTEASLIAKEHRWVKWVSEWVSHCCVESPGRGGNTAPYKQHSLTHPVTQNML